MINLNKELWKDIPNFDGLYQVSNLGRVRSFKGKQTRILQPSAVNGYLGVSLYLNNKFKRLYIHRLVAEAFLAPPSQTLKDEALTYRNHNYGIVPVNHIDGVKSNNKPSNLEWTSSKRNIQHAVEHGLRDTSGVNNCSAKLNPTSILQIRALHAEGGHSQTLLAKQFDVTQPLISQIVKRKIWAHI